MLLVEVVSEKHTEESPIPYWVDVSVIDTDDLVRETYKVEEIIGYIHDNCNKFGNIVSVSTDIVSITLSNKGMYFKYEDYIFYVSPYKVICVRKDDYRIEIKVSQRIYLEINGVEVSNFRGYKHLVLSIPYKMCSHMELDVYDVGRGYSDCDFVSRVQLKDFVYEKGVYSKMLKKELMR